MSFDFRPLKRANDPVDVWARVDRGSADTCWEWHGARNQKGYGVMRLRGKMIAAHRVAFLAHTGRAPGALCVLHHCDNPPCCNPAHLFLGTRGDNNRDASRKGRSAHGARNFNTKLTAEQARAIRSRRAAGETGVALAAEFNITPQAVSCIYRGVSWSRA